MIKSIRASNFTLKCDKCGSDNTHVEISKISGCNDDLWMEEYTRLTIKCIDCKETFIGEY